MSSIVTELDCIYSGNNVTVGVSISAAFLQRDLYSLAVLVLVPTVGLHNQSVQCTRHESSKDQYCSGHVNAIPCYEYVGILLRTGRQIRTAPASHPPPSRPCGISFGLNVSLASLFALCSWVPVLSCLYPSVEAMCLVIVTNCSHVANCRVTV